MPHPSLADGEIAEPPPGWYGKLPGLGDFATRRLPPAFVEAWDDWLARGLAHAQTELGESWLEAYLVAPILRFWLAPGVVASGGWAGLVMPSVDRVGRHFPLTLAAPAEAAPRGPVDAIASAAWFDALDAAAREVLDLDVTVAHFEALLARLPARVTAGEPAAPAETTERAPGSLWWRAGAASLAQCRAYTGLPPPDAFVALLEAAR